MNIQAIIGGITLVSIIVGSTVSANSYFATNSRVDEIEVTINADRLESRIARLQAEIRQVLRDIDLYGDTADRRGMLMSLQQKLKLLEKKLEKLS